MRKQRETIIISTCSFLLAFLTACGSGNGGLGNGGFGGGDSGSHEGMISFREDIIELGENVDNVPYLGANNETDNDSGIDLTTQSTSKSEVVACNVQTLDAGLGTDINKPMFPDGNQPGSNWGNIVYSIDVNKPEDDVYFNDYASSRQYVSPCAELFYIGAANNVLDFDVKYVKENVFQNVTMLNRWIKHTDNSMLRMRYDQVNNVLSCEELMSYVDSNGPYFHYHCTTSSYTPDGKEIIEFVSTRQRNIGDYKYSKFYRYVEDKEQLYFTVHDEEMYGVVYSDLSQENPLVTAFVYEKSRNGELLPGQNPGEVYETISKEIYIPQSETDCGFAANINTQLVDGEIEYSSFQQILIDSHGLSIGYINEGDLAINFPYITNLDYSISFSEGIDVARFMEDYEYSQIYKDLEYMANNVTYNFDLDGQKFTDPAEEGLPFYVSFGMFSSRAMGFNFEESQLLTTLQNSGLTLETNCAEQVARFLERDEFLSTHSMYGYTLDSTLTSDIIHDIFIRYIKTFSHVSDEELQSYEISDALPMSDQIVDEQYYAIYNVEFTGAVTFNEEDKTLDVSNVSATMPENLALNGGETLVLVVAYSTGCDTYELERKSFTYDKADLVMSFDAGTKVGVPEMNGEGQFYFYVLNESNKPIRVSTTFSPSCADVDAVFTSGGLVQRLYVKDNMLFVRQAPIFTVNSLVENETVYSPLNFVQACGAFIEGDYAIVTVHSDSTQVGQFMYDFDQNINPESITLDSSVDTQTLRYVLTIYNANDVEIYTQTL